MEISQDPQDHASNFQSKMKKVLEIFFCQCEQLENLIFNELRDAQNKESALAIEIEQKSLQQMNVLERSKLKDLQTKIDRKRSKIAELKSFMIQVQQFQDSQVQSLENYFFDAHKSHPLVKIDGKQQVPVDQQQNESPALVQQLYLQIQDLQIKIKNFELDIQMKDVQQQQLKELTERHSQLEVAHKKKDADVVQLIQELTTLQEFNKKLQNELDKQILNSKNLQSQPESIISQEKSASKIQTQQAQIDSVDKSDFQQMPKAQAGLCPICKVEPLKQDQDKSCLKCNQGCSGQEEIRCNYCGDLTSKKYYNQLACVDCQKVMCTYCAISVNEKEYLCRYCAKKNCASCKKQKEPKGSILCDDCKRKFEASQTCHTCGYRQKKIGYTFCYKCYADTGIY